MIVYNTLHRQKTEFVPREPGKVSMYVCGVTPYDALHLGHARTFLSYDMIRRHLEYAGYDVFHVQNVTDIDDKIINRARETGGDAFALAKRFSDEALHDCDDLGLLRAHGYPTVTGHIAEIIGLIEGLVAREAAYVRNGSVYFDVSHFPRYGHLSHQNTEEMQSSGRIEVDDNKDDALDFALWKAAKPEEPNWDSPWGKGRPGWHIECSAMSLKYLQNGFDIHGGAIELQFPHHENEVAQSEAYTGAPFVRYWLHGGVVFVDGKKMSKSLGNFITVRDILKQVSPNVVRMLFLMTHYRSPYDYSSGKLDEARSAWDRIQQGLRTLHREMGEGSESDAASPQVSGALADYAVQSEKRFREAMDDDFNTPVAIAALFELVAESHRFLSSTSDSVERSLQAAMACGTLDRLLTVLGFGAEQETGMASDQSADLVELLIEVRHLARSQKQFTIADTIRDRLNDLGVVLEDHKDGTAWRKKS